MSWIDGERASRCFFGRTILPVLLEPERIHRQDARVAGHPELPFGQDLRQAIAQHLPRAKAEVERMCDLESENIVRPFSYDSTSVSEHALGIVSQHPFNLRRGISAMSEQELERMFTSRKRL